MQILTTPDPFLRRVATPVVKYDQKLHQQVQEMTQLLLSSQDPEGVGLAATQVGLDARLFLLILDDHQNPQVFINPEIIKASTTMLSAKHKTPKKRWLEGCLSIPKFWGFVDRPFEITLRFQTPVLQKDGHWTLETQDKVFQDAQSAYAQHERDHLDGILFTDHIQKQQGTLFIEKDDELYPVQLP